MDIEHIKKSIRNVPDFPKLGIQFKDITTLLQDTDVFQETIDIFYRQFKNKKIDTVVGIESRGFIFAAPLASKLGCSLAIARKPGKLPGYGLVILATDHDSLDYDLILQNAKCIIDTRGRYHHNKTAVRA